MKRQPSSVATTVFAIFAFIVISYVAGFLFLPPPKFSHPVLKPFQERALKAHATLFYPARVLAHREPAPKRILRVIRVGPWPDRPGDYLIVEESNAQVPGIYEPIPISPEWSSIVAALQEGDLIETTGVLEPLVSYHGFTYRFLSVRKVPPPTPTPPAPPHPSAR